MESSTTVGFGGTEGWETASFTEHTADGEERLVAIVFQLGRAQSQGGQRLAPLRRYAMANPTRFRIYMKFMFVGMFARLLFRRRRLGVLPHGFDSGSSMGRVDEVLYSASKKLVRVAGRELSVPQDERTFVIMVRHDHAGHAPRVATHHVDVPTVPQTPPRDLTLDNAARGKIMGEHMRARDLTWNSALSADPVVSAFLAQ